MGYRSRLTGEGSFFSQWWQKYGTKKVETTGLDMDMETFKSEKGDQMDGRRGSINGHVAWVFRG